VFLKYVNDQLSKNIRELGELLPRINTILRIGTYRSHDGFFELSYPSLMLNKFVGYLGVVSRTLVEDADYVNSIDNQLFKKLMRVLCKLKPSLLRETDENFDFKICITHFLLHTTIEKDWSVESLKVNLWNLRKAIYAADNKSYYPTIEQYSSAVTAGLIGHIEHTRFEGELLGTFVRSIINTYNTFSTKIVPCIAPATIVASMDQLQFAIYLVFVRFIDSKSLDNRDILQLLRVSVESNNLCIGNSKEYDGRLHNIESLISRSHRSDLLKKTAVDLINIHNSIKTTYDFNKRGLKNNSSQNTIQTARSQHTSLVYRFSKGLASKVGL
jgi:hypothetical protein